VKGIIFNLLEEVTVEALGEAGWDRALEAADSAGTYTSVGNYPDEELVRLLSAAAGAIGIPADDHLTWFGHHALGKLAQTYSSFFEPHRSARDLVLTLNDVIHPEVRKIYPGADVPDFEFEEGTDGALVVGYRSARRMCRFAQGLIQGAAAYYGEDAIVEHIECMNRGDERCLMRCSFTPRGG